jgi:hypothetical protein
MNGYLYSMDGKELLNQIADNISNDIINENLHLNCKIKELKRYIQFLESKVEVLQNGLNDLAKSRGFDIYKE